VGKLGASASEGIRPLIGESERSSHRLVGPIADNQRVDSRRQVARAVQQRAPLDRIPAAGRHESDEFAQFEFGEAFAHGFAFGADEGGQFLVAEAEAELDAVMRRLTGYDQTVLDRMAEDGTSFGAFLTGAPARAPARDKITGVVCGVRVEEVADPVLREMRRLDKLVEELARGKVVETAIRG